jgi:nitroreductase
MTHRFIPYSYQHPGADQVAARAHSSFVEMDLRRTVRDFSSEPVPRSVMEDLVRAASTAPSGAHRQPWTFVAVGNPDLKRQIRLAAEEEERRNYHGRMPDDWLQALVPLGTDEHKPFLEIAPWLVVLFKQDHSLGPNQEKWKNYYVAESVGIAAGMFITAVHRAGLVCLTHTPSPMGFLQELLERPAHERAFLLMPVGYPADGAQVPDLKRKDIEEVLIVHE